MLVQLSVGAFTEDTGKIVYISSAIHSERRGGVRLNQECPWSVTWPRGDG